jgi:Transcriptional regulators of sugar metabolism
MIPYERQEAIINLLKGKKFLKTQALSRELFVSSATIRRDLAEMEEKGLIRRVTGGAIIIKEPKDLPYDYTNRINLEQKEVIASIAVTLIKDNQKLFLDSSTTTYRIINKLKKFANLTILTNGIHTATKLCELNNVEVYLIGGNINKSYFNIYGPEANQNIKMHYSDITFISCRGLSTKGATDSNEGEAALKREFAHNTGCLVLLVDSSKFNVTYFNISAYFDDIDVIISDKALPPDIRDIAEKKNIRILYENK